jgi:hypothetical protein
MCVPRYLLPGWSCIALPEMLLSKGFAVALNVLPAELLFSRSPDALLERLPSSAIWAIATELPNASTIAVTSVRFILTISMFVIIKAATGETYGSCRREFQQTAANNFSARLKLGSRIVRSRAPGYLPAVEKAA